MSDTSATSDSGDLFDQHLNTGGDLLRQDRVDEAKAELAAAIEIRNDDVKALGLFGLACFRLSAFEEALPCYQRLVELRPTDASYRLNLGLVHLKLGNAAQSVRELVKSRDLDPSQQRTVAYLGLAHARMGDFARAYEAFLQSGQEQLASEMESHLTEEQRQAIKDRMASGATPESDEGFGVASDAYEIVERTGNPEMDGATAFAEAQRRAALAEKRRAAGVNVPPESEPPPPLPAPRAAPAAATRELGPEAEDEWEAGVAVATPTPGAPAAGGEVSGRPAAEEEIEEISDAELHALEERRSVQMEAVEAQAVEAQAVEAQAVEAQAVPAIAQEADTRPARAVEARPARAVEARPEPISEGLVTQALAVAVPSSAAQQAATRVGVGQTAPLPLTELATARLIRPEDGDAPFEIGASGVLIVRVNERVISRTEEVMVSCGELGFEPATRRVRGAATSEIFGEGDKNLFIVTGKGYLVAAAGGHVFTAVALDDDILYLRETLVFAFEEQLRWENGHVPGSNGQMHVVQFRGKGCVVVRSRRPLLSLKLTSDRVAYVESSVLGGWIGRVVPRLVTPAAGGKSSATFVECSGEGVVLIEDQGLTVPPHPGAEAHGGIPR